MINKRNRSLKWILLSVICLLLMFWLYLYKPEISVRKVSHIIQQIRVKDVVNIVAILSGISGILVGASSIRISNLGAVEEYFQQGDSPEYTVARRRLYEKIDKNERIDKDDLDAAVVVSFFHFWGLMVKKHYLPIWVFESASGYAVIRLYEGLTDMITQRRQDNPQYAQYFEWLYKRVKRKLNGYQENFYKRNSQCGNTLSKNSFYSEEEIRKLGFAQIGQNVLISRKASIYNAHMMRIGDNVRVDDFCILSGKISLGSHIHISPYSCLIAGTYGIEADDFVTISSRCAIYAESDNFDGKTMTNPMIPSPYRLSYGEKVCLKKHCILGSGTTVLPGCVLAEGTAVGAMSLVKNNTVSWKIYAGIPCRIIKDRSNMSLELEEEYVANKQ